MKVRKLLGVLIKVMIDLPAVSPISSFYIIDFV